MAPELIHPVKFGPRHSQLSKGGAIYAMGMIAYEVLMGIHLFDVESLREQRIVHVVLDKARPVIHQTRNLEVVGLGREVWELVERSGRQTGCSDP